MTANVHRRGVRAAVESEPALEVLYVRYSEFVRRALRKHYVDAGEIEDVTQQVFLVLLRRVDEVAQTRSLGSWLYQIIRRVAANHHRGRRRLVRKHDELAIHCEAGAARDTGDPEDAYARAQAWTFIREFLESLDEEACAVFVMSEIEGLRGAEIAARLRLSLPMTYARIRTVRARFDRELVRSRRGAFAGLWAMHVFATSWRLKAGIGVALLALVGWLAIRGSGGEGPQDPGASGLASDRSEPDDREAARTRALDPDEIRQGPDKTGVFAGIVVDPDGAPIADATVCAGRGEDNEYRLTDPPLCATTDGAGHFRIEDALVRAHTLEAMARGFVPGRFHGRPTDHVRIVLHAGGVGLAGVVSDVHGGPVEGAWVSVENRSDGTLGATATTDEAGAFSLWVVEGPVSLAAGADGYAASFDLALAPATDVHIELGAESVLAGIVVDGETGEPMAGILVGALLVPDAERYANRGRVAVSDAQGRWEIRGLQPNQYVLDAGGGRSWGRAAEFIDLGIAERQGGIRIEMMAGADIVGRIFDEASGEGCVEGYAVTDDHTQNRDRGGLVHGDGLVAIEALTGGAVYEVTATCVGYANRTFEVDLRDGIAEPQEWPLVRGGELVVRVLDDVGTPLPDWTVDVSELGEETTDAEGSAVFAGVMPGTRHIVARGPGHPPVSAENVDVGADRSVVELRAASGVAVTGTVVSSDGHPVAGALVALQGPSAAGPLALSNDLSTLELVSGAGPYHAITNAAGEFRHASVAAGGYGVWVQPADAAVAVQRPGTHPSGFAARVTGKPLREVEVNDRAVVLALELGKLRSIFGVVRDDDGDVITDARVYAVREHDGEDPDPRGRPRLTDTHGRYAFDDLPAGTYSLTAYRHGGGIARREGVVAGGRAIDLVFPKVGRISGRVRFADGSAVKGYFLHVEGGAQRDRPGYPVGSKDGRFVASGLEAGRYEVSVMAPEGQGSASVDLAPGEHRAGVEITLVPKTEVKGRIVDGEQKPLVGWAVALRMPVTSADHPGEIANITVTGDDGRFLLGRVDPQAWDFMALPGSRNLFPPHYEPNDPVWRTPALRVVTPTVGETLDLGDIVMAPMD
jgi:RNA polymerase sigma factor (sigma-70 family)